MTGSYSQSLVLFSLLVAILASYTALDMAGRLATTQGRVARWWLAGGATAMGLGIWSMHFIGMLAFKLPIPIGYDLAITFYSLAVSVGASAYALWLVSRPLLPTHRLVAGAVLLGLGIATMHYLGMAAMRMQPGIDYDPLWFTASILIAIGAAGAALWIAFRLRAERRNTRSLRGLASLVMGVAIVGMHYTGMAAARFPADSLCGAVIDGGIDAQWLAVLVIVTTLGTIGIALVASLFDRQMRERTGLLAESLERANDKLLQAALHDPLTQLPNRSLLQDRIEQSIEKARRRHHGVAVMFCDLDGFKTVNDAYGHQLGDRLLVKVSQRIGSLLRPQDTLARLGGDEFVIVLPVDEPDDAVVVAERIIAAVGKPFSIESAELQVTASLGIALYPDDANDERQLMANADAAMYHTKQGGRNGYTFFTPSMQVSANRQLRLLQDLRRATDRGELLLHYQPKFMASGAPAVGAEALLRWQHPELGMLGPDVFIPIAERSGLILPIGDWVLDQACAQLRAWHDAGHPHWTMAVNLSPLQFAAPGLVETVKETLQKHGLEADRLTLEITETTAMKNVETSLQILNALTRLGVRISIDDFGTGYSSLLYLKRMPATELKIDRAFVRDLEQNAEDAAIVSSIVALGRSLQLKVVAEGVETAGQRDYLSNLGCDQLQGYHLGRPMAAEDFLRKVG
ncbi:MULTISPECIES: bifunctional diguanylate cyclase/phosphodiesterase [unclassified Stenotrophomonas]|uniref:putative bifunctional diguanylate cyclase/phosphodiesterase n=1 Tax=unclassified Stenotrophomonas TaxID=196198 RepID=UPI0017876838|nr:MULTISPECIES: bifunctional diguanylate cyclase/phosphodiesterase [unclassified Stenotrophomonas]MBD8636695.1 EAL domain-containing protein [Stenotrophomonas sp. CFBP 13725]MBD8696873.1 EAL domain-containing protein [Stenotrophomonas sp. CFBP 13718]